MYMWLDQCHDRCENRLCYSFIVHNYVNNKHKYWRFSVARLCIVKRYACAAEIWTNVCHTYHHHR